MGFFLLGRESDEVRLIAPALFSTRHEALSELARLSALPDGIPAEELFVVDLESAIPVLLVPGSTPSAPVSSDEALEAENAAVWEAPVAEIPEPESERPPIEATVGEPETEEDSLQEEIVSDPAPTVSETHPATSETESSDVTPLESPVPEVESEVAPTAKDPAEMPPPEEPAEIPPVEEPPEIPPIEEPAEIPPVEEPPEIPEPVIEPVPEPVPEPRPEPVPEAEPDIEPRPDPEPERTSESWPWNVSGVDVDAKPTSMAEPESPTSTTPSIAEPASIAPPVADNEVDSSDTLSSLEEPAVDSALSGADEPEPVTDETTPSATKTYDASALDLGSLTCDDCVYLNTCPKRGESDPASCGSFQWKPL